MEPATMGVDINPYGLEALWNRGDLVTQGTLGLLLIMSVISWSVLIMKLLEQSWLFRQARVARVFLDGSASLADGADRLAATSPFRRIALSGIGAVNQHHGAITGRIDLNAWITLSLQRAVTQVVTRDQSGVAVLASIASTAPFVGLFGTVWGIYHALTAIGIAGQATIDKVAGPVGEALIMTAMGLAVAVPAVLGYNWLVSRNKRVAEAVRAFAIDLHAALLSRGPGA